MKKMCLALASLLFAACAHPPAHTTAADQEGRRTLSASYVKRAIVKGKTTRKELVDQVGVPNSIRNRGPGQSGGAAEVWYYWTAPPLQAVAQGGVQPIFRMTVDLDDNGVVQDYSAADTSVVIR